MRVFVGNLSTSLGAEIARQIRSAEVVGAVDSLKQAQITKKRLVENRDPEIGEGLEGPDAFVESPVVAAADKHSVSVLLKRCHVAIYSVVDDPEGTLEALKTFAEGSDDTPKLFIAVSSVLTWAKTPIPPKQEEWKGHKEAEFKQRKPARKYAEYKAVETQVLSTRREGFSTIVIASGLIYGGAQEAWLNSDKDLIIPSIAGVNGNNYLPMMNIYDLARVIGKIATNPGSPPATYMLALDQSRNTLREICVAISNSLGNGNVRDLSPVEAEELLLTERSIVHLQLNQQFDMEGSALEGLEIEWQWQSGIVPNIEAVAKDYMNSMDLRPLRIAVLGPPRVGKTNLSSVLAKSYYIPHVTPTNAANELLSLGKLKEPLLALKEEVKKYKLDMMSLPLQIATELLKWKLSLPVCRNQGYVLDGSPYSLEQAKTLFTVVVPTESEEGNAEEVAEESKVDDETKEGDEANDDKSKKKKSIVFAPNYVIAMTAPKALLQRRAQSLSQEEAEKSGNTENEFSKRFELYNTEKTNGLLTFFEKDNALEVLELELKTEEMYESKKSLIEPITKYLEQGGKPFNFHPTKEEVIARQREIDEQLALETEAEQKRQNDILAQEMAEKQTRVQSEKSRLEIIQREEMDVLEARSKPLRAYLMETVIPALTEGMLEVVKVQPEDPIDYLADFLFRKGQTLET
ncbi:adenylate kinase [Thraustotheca clavata]|uniref:Adenylate kinase n=1 Tax=Thraustotheca clavata TaxID=74557 RepID=A0A1V9ZA81_9STRA|nr:adenylate kinase [Thraustotheca clavata]